MLGKLMKYDLLKYKYYAYPYLLVPLFAVLTRITNAVPDKSVAMVIIDKFVSGATMGLTIGVGVNLIIRSFVNFDLSLYGDESYLTHTLPVRRADLYTAKGLSAIAVIVVSAIISSCGFCIVTDIHLTERKVPVLTLLMLTEIICITLTVYLGIILGNRKNTHKKVFSILYSVAVYIAEQALVFVYLLVKFGKVFFTVNDDQIPQQLFSSVYVMIVVYCVYCIMLFFLGRRALEKGVNVD